MLPYLLADSALPAAFSAAQSSACEPKHPEPRDILNLGAIRNVLSRELVPAQAAGQISSEPQLPQPDLEQLLATRTGQIDPCAPVIFEHATTSG